MFLAKKMKDGCAFATIFIFVTFIIYMNWKFAESDRLYYAALRPELLSKLLGEIKAGKIPEFLSQLEHSWGFTLYLPYLAYFLHVEDMYQFLLAIHMVYSWLALICFSIEIYIITKNRIATLISPLLIHIFCGNALYGFKTETCWSGGWLL